MCKIVQHSFSFSPVALGAELDTLKELDAAAMRQGLTSCIIDPCKGCDLAEVCDHDDCGYHLFELDVPEPPHGEWYDWRFDLIKG